ncbi:uncharacterized protein LOC109004317 [Juglans regia]|uniref:Uncharacterized protein LOC109004317 n=1 Tax=Juglans regia TaxID=51240 RepID=A0A2I4G3A3_JUGRE|nr:uncharacterized protein LOC109004317 [Juglans regia]
MCPMRFILVFFSAMLAAYFAWKTVHSSPQTDKILEDITLDKTSTIDKPEFNLKKTIQECFWVFVDMASGRYLWRNLRKNEHVKSC